MHIAAPVEIRPNISSDLANALHDMIARGDLKPGERINEVRLAASLGVSRTPLREALTALAGEGALHSIPRRGFFVRELSRAELEGIYPVRALLDPEALRLAGLPDEGRIDRLEALNERLAQARKVATRLDLDDAWHLMLLEDCPNPVLLDLIRHFIRRTRRYEVAYLEASENLGTAVDEHRTILAALRSRKLEAACHALKQNLTSGVQPILAWLDQRELRGG